jgi:hypothetical protein
MNDSNLERLTEIKFQYSSDNITVVIGKPYSDKVGNVLPLSYQETNFRMTETPLTVMTNMMNSFKNIFVYGTSSLEDIVKNTMELFNKPSPSSLKEIQLRKDYSRYYYFILKNRKIDFDQSTDNKKTAQIIIELVCWWFIRRFVHLYVTCTCLERLLQTASISTNSSSSIIYTSPVSQNLEKIKGSVDKDTYDTLNQMYTNQTSEITALRKELQNKQRDLDNLRELLLSSTSMLFKMDELLPS